MPVAKVGDIEIYYEIQGAGDPLLLIMGYGFSHGNWFAIRNKLATEHQLILFDNRGTGRSHKPDLPYTPQMMAGDAVGLLDAIGVSRASVFGVSMGGMIAQEFALAYPDRLKNLVLGCTSCGGTRAVPVTAEAITFLLDPERAKLSEEEKALNTIPWLWNEEFVQNHPEVVERFMRTHSEYPTPPHTFVSQGNVLMTFDSYDRLTEVKAPTLVICGAKDRLIPPENSRILASRIPKAELAMLEKAGHGFITDSTEESSSIILRFLKKHS